MAVAKKTVAKATDKKKPNAVKPAAKGKAPASPAAKASATATSAAGKKPAAGKAAAAARPVAAKKATPPPAAKAAAKPPAKAAAKPAAKAAAKPATKATAKPTPVAKPAAKTPAKAAKPTPVAVEKKSETKASATSTKVSKGTTANPTKAAPGKPVKKHETINKTGQPDRIPASPGKSASKPAAARGKTAPAVSAEEIPSANPTGKGAGTPIQSPTRLAKSTNRTVVRATSKGTENFATSAVVLSGPNPVKETSKPIAKGKEESKMMTNDSKAGTDKISIKSAAPQTTSKAGRKLKPEDLKKLKQMLLHERERIVEEMRTLDDRSLTPSSENDDSQQPGFSLQLADSATDNIQVETDLAIRNIEAEQLAQIDDALRAIETGDYGTCNRCQQSIDFERLKAKPNARYCVACLRLLEAGKA